MTTTAGGDEEWDLAGSAWNLRRFTEILYLMLQGKTSICPMSWATRMNPPSTRGQEEGVSSNWESLGNFSYPVKEASGAKSSIPVSLESVRSRRSRKEDLSNTSAHRSVSLPIFLCITMSRPPDFKGREGLESRESSSFLERGLWLSQAAYLQNG